MKRGLIWRTFVAVTVIVLGFYVLLPDLLRIQKSGEETGGGIAAFLPPTHISLGLDLRGGIHLTLGVEVDKAVESTLAQLGQDLMSTANGQGLLMTTPTPAASETIEFFFTQSAKQKEFEQLLQKEFPQFVFGAPASFPNGRLKYSLRLDSAERDALEDLVLENALKTIRSRIDQFGVAEPDIRKQQDGRISIQLPGMDNTERAVAIIGKTAHLEFRLVKDNVDTSRPAPPGVEFLPYLDRSASGTQNNRLVAVEKQASLTGANIADASVRFSQEDGEPSVSLTFDRRGSQVFSRITGANIGKGLAIVLDGKVYSAPRIKAQIEGTASITGGFSTEEATDLALVLRAGSLPAPVTVLEERTVGPSLGQESINMGITAAIIGGALVMVFMAVYYSFSGLIANLMLVFDVALILAGMACFGATLTLPGIAGIVLTIGMAVDANVLIFERIREELRRGLTTVSAIDVGFSRAMLAIVDSNLTTIIAAVILYQFGTGPIKGFAVTLTLGIVASMFTAIFVSRVIFDYWMGKPGRKLYI